MAKYIKISGLIAFLTILPIMLVAQESARDKKDADKYYEVSKISWDFDPSVDNSKNKKQLKRYLNLGNLTEGRKFTRRSLANKLLFLQARVRQQYSLVVYFDPYFYDDDLKVEIDILISPILFPLAFGGGNAYGAIGLLNKPLPNSQILFGVGYNKQFVEIKAKDIVGLPLGFRALVGHEFLNPFNFSKISSWLGTEIDTYFTPIPEIKLGLSNNLATEIDINTGRVGFLYKLGGFAELDLLYLRNPYLFGVDLEYRYSYELSGFNVGNQLNNGRILVMFQPRASWFAMEAELELDYLVSPSSDSIESRIPGLYTDGLLQYLGAIRNNIIFTQIGNPKEAFLNEIRFDLALGTGIYIGNIDSSLSGLLGKPPTISILGGPTWYLQVPFIGQLRLETQFGWNFMSNKFAFSINFSVDG